MNQYTEDAYCKEGHVYLQATNFKSKNDLINAMFNVAEQALGKVVQSGRVTSVWQAQIPRLVQTKSVADKIVLAVLCNNGFILWIAERVKQLVDRAVDDCHLCEVEEALTATAKTKVSTERSPFRMTKRSEIPSDLELPEDNGSCCSSSCSLSHSNCRKKSISRQGYSTSDGDSDTFPKCRSR